MDRGALSVGYSLGISFSNTILYLVLGQGEDFVSVSMVFTIAFFSLAVSEFGSSFVAPKFLRREGAIELSRAWYILSLNTILYFIISTACLIGFGQGLSDFYILLYVLIPLVMPAWLIFNMRSFLAIMAIGVIRVISLALAFFGFDQLFQLWVVGSFFFSVGVLAVYVPMQGLKVDVYIELYEHVKEIFYSKTITYGFYSFTPLLLGALTTNAVTANYFYLERLKSIGVTLFQPLFQGGFLSKSFIEKDGRMYVILIVALLFLFDFILFFLSDFINGFSGVLSVFTLLLLTLTINVCVLSYTIIYLHVLPTNQMKLLALSMYFQAVVILLSVLSFYHVGGNPVVVLVAAEVAYFLFLFFCLVRNKLC